MEEKFKVVRLMAILMDSQFSIAGVRFGIDPLLGLIPVVGDFVALILSLLILRLANDFKVSKFDKFRMYLNVVIDFILKLFPVIGEIFDVAFKANLRNVKILEKYATPNVIEGKVLSQELV